MRCAICWLWLMDTFTTGNSLHGSEAVTSTTGLVPRPATSCEHTRLVWAQTQPIVLHQDIHHIPAEIKKKQKNKEPKKTISVVIDMKLSLLNHAAVDNRECCCSVPKVSRIDGFLAGTSLSWIKVSPSNYDTTCLSSPMAYWHLVLTVTTGGSCTSWLPPSYPR